MLQAMNTGHDGSMSTVHANTTRDALTRVESMVQMGNIGLPTRAIRTQIAGAVDLIVQVERQRDGGRRIRQVTELCGMEGDVIMMNDIFQLEVLGERPDGRLHGRYQVSRTQPFAKRPARHISAWNGSGWRPWSARPHDAWGSILLLAFSGANRVGRKLAASGRSPARRRRMAERLGGPVGDSRLRRFPDHFARGRQAGPICGRIADLFGCDWNRRADFTLAVVARLLRTLGAAIAVYFVVGKLAGKWAVLAAPVGWIMAAGHCSRNGSVAQQKLLSQFGDALGMVVRTLSRRRADGRGGEAHSPRVSGTDRERVPPVGRGDRHRLSLDEAVSAMAERTGMTEYRFFATTITLQIQTGGGLSEALKIWPRWSAAGRVRARGYRTVVGSANERQSAHGAPVRGRARNALALSRLHGPAAVYRDRPSLA